MTSRNRRIPFLLFLSMQLFLSISVVHAASSARIVATEPAMDATLKRQQSFWVRIEYQTDEAIDLWARPYRNGVQIKQAMTNASLLHTGSGEALGWFALIEPEAVDEVRIFAGGGKPFREWELARQPVNLNWTNATGSPAQHAQWVTDLLASEEARSREAAQQRAREPAAVGEATLFNGFMLTVPFA